MNETVNRYQALAARLLALQVKQGKRLPESPKREASAFAKKIAEAAARFRRWKGMTT
jgi:hypothetical protein